MPFIDDFGIDHFLFFVLGLWFTLRGAASLGGSAVKLGRDGLPGFVEPIRR